MTLGLLLSLALGAELITAPGAGLVVPDCVPEAPCWAQAPRVERFVSAAGASHLVVELDVRVGRQGGALWVEVPRLPEGAVLEWVLQPDGNTEDPTSGALAQLWTLTEGTHRLEAELREGEVRAFRALLRLPGELPLTLPWTPAGEQGFPSLWAELLPGSAPLELTVSRELTGGDCSMVLAAPGATRWRVLARPPAHRWHGLRADLRAAWRGDGERATIPCPRGGRLDIHASDGAGRAAWRSVRWPSSAVLPRLEGLVPRPAEVELDGGEVMATALRSASGEPSLVALLQREWARVVGGALEVEEAANASIVLTVDPALDAEAFVIELAQRGVVARAGSTRSLAWAALAVVDVFGFDGSAPTGRLTDAPALPRRPFIHRLDEGYRGPLDVEAYLAFVERVVARGRYSHLVLDLRATYPWKERALRRFPLAAADLDRIRRHAEALGITVAFGLDPYGDVGFLLKGQREWGEDGDGEVRAARQPAARRRVETLVEELQVGFGGADTWWLDLDWVGWMTQHRRGAGRTQRTAATPRWVLLEDELAHWVRFAEAQGIEPWIGTGMLLQRALGGRLGTWRALDGLTEAERGRVSWLHSASRPRALGEARERGLEVVRLHRGYQQAYRSGLLRQLQKGGVVGEGLWTDQGAPFSAAPNEAPGTVAASGHYSRVWLAGVTAWQPALAEEDLDGLLAEALDLPALHPMERPDWSETSSVVRTLAAGESTALDEVSLTWALVPTAEQEARFTAGRHRGESWWGAPVATVVLRDEAGVEERIDVHWGEQIERRWLGGTVVPAWRAAATLRDGDLDGGTWTRWRWDGELDGREVELQAHMDLVLRLAERGD